MSSTQEQYDSGVVARQGELVVVTGMTGAGRSTAAKALEDIGYYVVDNIPPEMVGDLVTLIDRKQGQSQPLAVVVDVRADVFFAELNKTLRTGLSDRRPTLVFLEADDDILVRRQEAARRPHPLQGEDRLLDGIHRERVVLEQLRGDADLLVDTTRLNVRQLKARIEEAFGDPDLSQLAISVLSFGFKYGVPIDADLMADARFLPNPYWIPELRPYNGTDEAVASYVMGQPGAEEFMERYQGVVETVAEGYRKEGKRFMNVAVGCTGGKHRSVSITEEIARRLRAAGLRATASHRDLGRE